MTFSEALAEEMAALGLTQEVTAEIVGVSQPTVSGWLRRGSEPNGDTLLRILRVMPGLRVRLGLSDKAVA